MSAFGVSEPEKLYLRDASCKVCGSVECKLLFSAKDHEYRIPGSFRVVRCCECGLIFLSPMPPKQTVHEYYTTREYYSYGPIDVSPLRRLKDRLICLCTKAYSETQDGLLRRIRRLLLSPIRPKIIPMRPSGNRILDLGCGNGRYMLTLQKAGWEVYGCDLSKSGITIAAQQGLNVFHGTLPEAKFPSSFFDAVRLDHVFEHIEDPAELLKEIRRVLKPFGALVIRVPNGESLSFKLFGKHWGLLGVPFHLFQYSASTLEGILSRNGLQVVDFKYTAMTDCWLWSLNNFLNDKLNTGRQRGFLYKAIFKMVFILGIVPIVRLLNLPHRKWRDVVQADCIRINSPTAT